MRRSQRSSSMQTAARHTLVWGVLAFVLVQGGMRLAIDRVWPELRDPTFEIKLQRLHGALAEHAKPPLTVLMTGSSVTMNLFKAKHLEDDLNAELHQDAVVFNMATQGAGSVAQFVWVSRLLDRGVRPDLVCIEVSPHTYCAAAFPSDTKRFPAHLLTRSDFRTLHDFAPTDEMRREWRAYRWCPTHFHRLTIMNVAAHNLVPIVDRVPTWDGGQDERMWSNQPPLPAEQRDANIRGMRQIYGKSLADFKPDESRVHGLSQLLALLDAQKVPTVVVMAPQSPAFRQLFAAGKREAFVQRVHALADQHHATFLDASAWLVEEHFIDCVHATNIGGDIFSTRLKREVLLPSLSQRSRVLAQR